MIPRPPRSTQSRSSAASDVYKRQVLDPASPVFVQEENMRMGVVPTILARSSPIGRRLIAAATIALLAAGCSGGGGGTATVPAATQQQPASKGTASVTFTMKWNDTTQSAQRSPRYVPATARSVSVSVNGGVAQYMNAPLTTIVIDAPIGV